MTYTTEKLIKDTHTEFFKNRYDVESDGEYRMLLTADEIRAAVVTMANTLNAKFRESAVNGRPLVLTCILKGAAYFLVDISRLLTIPHSIYFIEASSYSGQKQRDSVELLSKIVPEKFQGRQIVLLDELFDSGKTMFELSRVLSKTLNIPSSEIFTMTLFIKKKAQKYPKPNLTGIILPDLWVIGYGLDGGRYKRGWTHLFAIPSIPYTPHDLWSCSFKVASDAHTLIRRALTTQF